jgi:hypothetical protein
MQHPREGQQIRVESKRTQKIPRIVRQSGAFGNSTLSYTRLNRSHRPAHTRHDVAVKLHSPGYMTKGRKLS